MAEHYCTECGKKLSFANRLLSSIDGLDMCIDCWNGKRYSGSDRILEEKTEKGFCKKCGKKLPILPLLADFCSDCYDEEQKRLYDQRIEERKHRKGHCKECGKSLPPIRPLNYDRTRRLTDVCSNCQFTKHINGKSVKPDEFLAQYIGGYAAYPEPQNVIMLTYPDHLEVPELSLAIPYNRLQNVQSMTEQQLKASRIFLVGLFAFAWKKRKDYLVITFTDVIGVEQSPVFDVDNLLAIQPFLYQQMLNAKASELASPQPVPQTISQQPPKGDPVEQLAKLKRMVEADLITEEEYKAKKTEILAKM